MQFSVVYLTTLTAMANAASLPTNTAPPSPIPSIKNPEQYSKLAVLVGNAETKECYFTLKSDQCNGKSARVGPYNTKNQFCGPDPDVKGSAICGNQTVTLWHGKHEFEGRPAELGQAVVSKPQEEVGKEGLAIPLGVYAGCWAGFEGGIWHGNCAAEFPPAK